MFRPTILIAGVIASLGLSAAVMARSTAPASSAQTSTSQLTQKSASADHRVIKPGDPNCLRDTGSLIPPKKGECMHVVGRSYSGDQMRRTGAQDNARALQMLDPSISVGH